MSYVLQFFYCSGCHGYFCHFVCSAEKRTDFLRYFGRACLAGLFYFVQAVGGMWFWAVWWQPLF